jgi:hypothetical protein
MHDASIPPAPEIRPAGAARTAWERERQAFLDLLPFLTETHLGQYVAVHEGRIVASGGNRIRVAFDSYDQVGYVPLYVGLVGEGPRRRVRLPSPRVIGRATRP